MRQSGLRKLIRSRNRDGTTRKRRSFGNGRTYDMVNATTTVVASAAPSVSAAVKIDWGSWVAQGLAAEADIIAAGAGQAEGLLLKDIPFGTLIQAFAGPAVVEDYVKQGLVALEGIVAGQSLAASSPLETYAFNTINQFEPLLAKELGEQLIPLIKAAIAKLLPAS